MVVVYFIIGDNVKALEEYKKSIELNPNFKMQLIISGLFIIIQGNTIKRPNIFFSS